ncbi:hypothetical protein [Aliarcobacter cibarius]|uniref:Uncharacterized protein n=1 Tax=Aliarcobacter cibarius TaxID=255507 RepID=A0ABY2V6V1_9BACT|nr:hypothetical protein [Aliarcobacter cibarius]TLS99946.1 hypothetical protein FE247_05285 [Aliarcobacter cibarius]TLT00355.1 hypothetical protein FE245_05715 [Aliarcobacter cibarius]
MRTIIGNIKILTTDDFANKKLTFILCDLYGRKLNSFDLENKVATIKTTTTDSNGNFTIELYETEKSNNPMFYKMQFLENTDIDDIKLFIQSGTNPIDFLKLLFPYPKLNMFFETKNEQIIFNDMVYGLFERYFTNEDIFVNLNEKNLLEEYVKYADGVRDSELMDKLDKFLGGI